MSKNKEKDKKRNNKNKENLDNRTIGLLSKKFILFTLIFVISTVFRWFDKMPAKYTAIIWISVGIIYGFWNVVNKLINQLTLDDIKDFFGRRRRRPRDSYEYHGDEDESEED